MFKLFLVCNNVPQADEADNAYKNRFHYIPFTAQYVDNPPSSPEEQARQRKYKKDPYFDQQIPELAVAFGWVIVQYYPAYKNEGLQPPDVIVQYTENYWRENDIYNSFKRDFLVQAYNERKEVDIKAICTAAEMYPIFRQYCIDNGVKLTEIPTMTMMKAEMKDKYRLGPMTSSNGWKGIKLIEKVTTIT